MAGIKLKYFYSKEHYMEFIKTDFDGDNNIGLYGFATDEYCLLGKEPNNKKKLESILGVEIKICPIAATTFVGIFVAGNKNGIIVPKIIEDEELEKLKQLGFNVTVIDSRETALGNLVLCNDNGCIISKLLEQYKDQIGEALGVKVEVGEVANFEIVGSAGKATNKGCLVHREANEDEVKAIEDNLKIKVDVGTISFGTPFIKAGVIVNSNGLIVSGTSTGPEIDRCFEVYE